MNIQPRTEILVKSVRKFLQTNAEQKLCNFLRKLRNEDIANIIDNLFFDNKRKIIRMMIERGFPHERLSEIISEIQPEDAAKLLEELDIDDLIAILNEMSSDDAAEIIDYFPENLKETVLSLMEKEESEDVKELLTYPEDSAGRIMTTEFYALHEDTSVSDAITAIQLARDVDAPFYLYVVDDGGKLTGIVSLKQLLLSSPDEKLKNIMNTDIIYVSTDTDQEEVAKLVAKYNLVAIPVVDKEGKLSGVITVDDIIDIIQEEATEDIYKMAGVIEGERVQDSIFESLKKRIPWLLLALLTTSFSAIVISFFQGTIKNTILLAVLMPIVAAIGGVAGNQTNAVVVREISLSEFDPKQARKMLVKHVLLGILLGVIVGIIAGGIIELIIHEKILSIVFALALMINILMGLTLGTLIPISFKLIKLDPALSSNMFVSMFTDTIGFFVFLMLAKIIIS